MRPSSLSHLADILLNVSCGLYDRNAQHGLVNDASA